MCSRFHHKLFSKRTIQWIGFTRVINRNIKRDQKDSEDFRFAKFNTIDLTINSYMFVAGRSRTKWQLMATMWWPLTTSWVILTSPQMLQILFRV
jgi:hypothetical protein